MTKKTILVAILIITLLSVIAFLYYKESVRKDSAILLAREYCPEGLSISADSIIRAYCINRKGFLQISGWKATRIENSKYYVKFICDTGAGKGGWFFEANLSGNFARFVNSDSSLRDLYGFNSMSSREFDDLFYRLGNLAALSKGNIGLAGFFEMENDKNVKNWFIGLWEKQP